jgi:hypothetical protein
MLSEQWENPQKGAKRRDSRNLYPPKGGKKGGREWRNGVLEWWG